MDPCSSHQKEYKTNSNIHGCGLTKKSKYEMHHKGNERKC